QADTAAARANQESCMTPHDAQGPTNLHFLSFWVVLADARKRAVFPRILPMKTGMWLGAESNRRHVDFQSTALPTELPSRMLKIGHHPRRSRAFTMPDSDC